MDMLFKPDSATLLFCSLDITDSTSYKGSLGHELLLGKNFVQYCTVYTVLSNELPLKMGRNLQQSLFLFWINFTKSDHVKNENFWQ